MTPRLGDRSLLPDLEVPLYLDHAAIGPTPAPVLAAGRAALERIARRGTAAIPELLPVTEAARDAAGALMGARGQDLALLGNTSQGVIAVAWCLDWRAGDRVLLFEGEFPANVTPWQRAAEHFGLELRWVPCSSFAVDPGRGLAAVEAELVRGLRLVAVSAVQFQTGLRMPLGELGALCRRHGAQLFVDGIQALGALPLDVHALGIDYLASGGHKWLMATMGTGVLWARDWGQLRPRLSSWLSHRDPLRFLGGVAGRLSYDQPLETGPAMLEAGVWNAVGHAMLGSACGLLRALGPEAIERHIGAWIGALEQGLTARGFTSARAAFPEGRSSILALAPPDDIDVPSLAGALRERGLALSTPDGWLRIAPHWPNALDEVPLVLAAVDEALAALRA